MAFPAFLGVLSIMRDAHNRRWRLVAAWHQGRDRRHAIISSKGPRV